MKIKISDITSTARLPDPNYATNRAILLLSAAVFLVGAMVRLVGGTSIVQSVLWGVGAGLSVFFAWALGRELDPDHDPSAFVGAGLMLLGLLFFGLPSLLAPFWLLLALRIVNRVVGLPPRPLDSLAILGLGGWLTWQGDWMAGLMTAVALLLDGLLAPPLRHHLLMSGVAFVAMLVLSIFQGELAMKSGPDLPTVFAVVGMAGLFVIVIATSRKVEAVGDATGEPLIPRRVQAAQIFALVTALLYAWWEGPSGVVALLSLWAAMVGVSLYRLAILLLGRSR
jgi:hypothetical protein